MPVATCSDRYGWVPLAAALFGVAVAGPRSVMVGLVVFDVQLANPDGKRALQVLDAK